MLIIWEIFKMAVNALRANKLRSSLTLVGIIIGVASVITIISALEGMSQSIKSEINKLGPTTFIVSKWGIITSGDAFWEALKRKPLKYEYVKAIEESCDECEEVAVRIYDQCELKYRNKKIRRGLVGGATSNLLDIIDIELEQGRFHSDEDDISSRRVAFIGWGIADELYSNLDPIGKTIKIDNVKYEVIGFAKKRGSSFGQSRDNFVMVPYLAFTKDFVSPRDNIDIMIKARSLATLEKAMDQTRVVLRAFRHVPYNKEDDFAILTAESIMKVVNETTKFIRLGLVGISSISLVVGGIVIMNIMMVSVTERTREIGIRKSIGAKQSNILLQFLFESLLLSLSGGMVGISIGVGLGYWLISLIDMNMSPSMYAIGLGIGISVGVGLFFGIYPALKAAKLEPVKALGYE